MKRFTFSTMVLAALCAGQAWGQGQTGATRPSIAPRQSGQTQPVPAAQSRPAVAAQQGGQQVGHSTQHLQQHAAACLLIGNQQEIALSEVGIERSESDEVKEFAREMVKEHTKFLSKLRKFTPQQASFELNVKADEQATVTNTTVKAAGQKEGSAPARGGEATVAKTAVAAGPITDQLLAMKRDKAHECLKITKENLEEHQGDAFDKAFLGTQVSAHIDMLAELRALKLHVSGEFAELVAEGEKSTEQHLHHAKDLMEKLASAGSEGSRGVVNEAPNGERPAAPRERPNTGREG